jgi:hypothetical protein
VEVQDLLVEQQLEDLVDQAVVELHLMELEELQHLDKVMRVDREQDQDQRVVLLLRVVEEVQVQLEIMEMGLLDLIMQELEMVEQVQM